MENSAVLNIKQLGFPWETSDPFLFCVHHEDFYPEGNDSMGPKNTSGRMIGNDFGGKDGWRMYHGSKVPGFPYHPHRGFETVTVVRKGFIDHTDSMGAAGRFGNGDVQWMTAGKGVNHSEMFPLLNRDKPNTLELFQIWLNLPKKSKMVEPHFKMLWSESLPVHKTTDEQDKPVEVEIVAGKIGDLVAPAPAPNSWAADPANDVAIWNIKMSAGSTWTIPAAQKGTNRKIYFFKGESLKADGQDIPSYHSAQLDPEKEVVLENGNEETFILLLQGKPIEEPVVQHGPFVMNTPGEIQETIMEYQRTQFGGWPWPEAEYTHPREAGRFAKHADGREEIKS